MSFHAQAPSSRCTRDTRDELASELVTELSEGLRKPLERPTALSLLAEFQAWLETPVLKPRLVFGRDVVVHPWDPHSFLFKPLNYRLVIPKDNTRHPSYRPLHSVKEFLKSTPARRATEFWNALLKGIADFCQAENRWDLWTLNMKKGFALPLQVC